MNQTNSIERQKIALEQIIALYDTPQGEFGPTLFVSHHLEEIEREYWVTCFGTESPKPKQILSALILVSSWSYDDTENIDVFDFSLPNDATNYMLSVRFGPDNQVTEISMES